MDKIMVRIKEFDLVKEVSSIHFGTRKVIVGYKFGELGWHGSGNTSFSFDEIEFVQPKQLRPKEEYEKALENIKFLDLDGAYGDFITVGEHSSADIAKLQELIDNLKEVTV